jgi:hypothetical protein
MGAMAASNAKGSPPMAAEPRQRGNWESRAFVRRHQPLTDRWLRDGAIAGSIAGTLFVLFKMLAALVMGDDPFMPIQRISTLVLGQQAAEPGYSVATALLVGLVVHMVLSAVYGVSFGAVVGSIAQVRSRPWLIVLAGFVLGVLLWAINLYLVGPAFFPWFGEGDAGIELLARTIFFGVPLGAWLASRPERKVTWTTAEHEGQQPRRDVV